MRLCIHDRVATWCLSTLGMAVPLRGTGEEGTADPLRGTEGGTTSRPSGTEAATAALRRSMAVGTTIPPRIMGVAMEVRHRGTEVATEVPLGATTDWEGVFTISECFQAAG
jgi:hypothetical protein